MIDVNKLSPEELALVNKFSLEESRFIRDCRKEALHKAHMMVSASTPSARSADVLKEADAFFDWLITIPEKK